MIKYINKFKNTFKINTLYLMIFLIVTLINLATYNNSLASHQHETANYYNTLAEYLNLPENINTKLKFISKSKDPLTGITKKEYSLNSQIWPKQGVKSEQKIWQHKVAIYIPARLKNTTALLWVNGGTNNPLNKSNTNQPLFNAYPLDFNQIANKTNTLVIDLRDIPNQYVTLDGKQYAEDGLIAYTWSKFLSEPNKNKYLPAYLPMVKAVVKTMDNITADNNYNIKNFIVSGLSKRGMTTWLTALHDTRVKAIIPVSIDILNVETNIKHIYKSLQDWPLALHDYYEQNVLQQLSKSNSNYLMQINDPLKYILCDKCKQHIKRKYQLRANIDKFIISASGDDFFTPDSSLFYYHKLPGTNHIRYIPNSRHYIDNKIVTDAIVNYLYNYHNKISLPKFRSNITKDFTRKNGYKIHISTDKKPKNITLYTAYNPSNRDFRLANGIQYQQTIISVDNFNKNLSKNNTGFNYSVSINKPEHGWQAAFVELEYQADNKNIPNLKLTTPVHILPKQYPAINKIKSSIKEKAKRVVKYGKKVIYNI